MLNGEMHGHGLLELADGAKYIGEFKNSKYNGNGLFTFDDGKKY